jgi:hypothetical protein
MGFYRNNHRGWARGRSFEKGPVGQCRRAERALQPEGEILLQICCRCSSGRSPTQLVVAAGGRWNRTDAPSAKTWDVQFVPWTVPATADRVARQYRVAGILFGHHV